MLDDMSGNIHLVLEGELAGFIVVGKSFDRVSINRAQSLIEYRFGTNVNKFQDRLTLPILLDCTIVP